MSKMCITGNLTCKEIHAVEEASVAVIARAGERLVENEVRDSRGQGRVGHGERINLYSKYW